MRSFDVVRAEDVRRVPWRNGRGVTEEIAVGQAGNAGPVGAAGASFERGDFAWRVSRAAVTESGPFSAFPGIDRVIVVTEGDGLALSHGDAAPPARIGRFERYRFSGEWPTSADLVGGPVRDFNVLTRRDAVRAEVKVIATGRGPAQATVRGGDSLLHAVGADVVVLAEGGGWTLRPGDTLRVSGGEGECVLALVGEPGSTVVIVRIEAARSV